MEHRTTITQPHAVPGLWIVRCTCGWKYEYQAGGGPPYHRELLAGTKEAAERGADIHKRGNR
jgi:hypothetical protein